MRSGDCIHPARRRVRDRNGDDPIVRRGGDPDEAPDERIVAQAIMRACRGDASKRSRGSAGSRDRRPSVAITPIRRPWLPEQATPAGSAMTLAACKSASGALLSKHSAALAIR
jgi:hypothetical protein